MTPPIHMGLAQHPIKKGPGARSLTMIHKLDSKLISKTKKKKIVIIVVVKFLSFIFGSHFAYSSIKIGFKLPKKKKNLQYFHKKNN